MHCSLVQSTIPSTEKWYLVVYLSIILHRLYFVSHTRNTASSITDRNISKSSYTFPPHVFQAGFHPEGGLRISSIEKCDLLPTVSRCSAFSSNPLFNLQNQNYHFDHRNKMWATEIIHPIFPKKNVLIKNGNCKRRRLKPVLHTSASGSSKIVETKVATSYRIQSERHAYLS